MSLFGRKCPSCGATVRPKMKYCGQCGHKMDPDDTGSIPPVVSSQLVNEILNPETGGAETPAGENRDKSGDSLGKHFLIGACAAAALVVVAFAALLIVRTNRPVSHEDRPEAIEAVHVISGTQDPTPEPTEEPEPENAGARSDSPLAKTAVSDPTPEPTPTPEPEIGDPVYVIPYGVNLRDGPGTGYDIVNAVTRGTELRRIGTVDEWTRVIYAGREGYVMSSLVTDVPPEPTEEPEPTDTPEPTEEPTPTPEPTPEPTPTPAVPAGRQDDTRGVAVTRYGVNVRSGPGTEYGVIDSLLSDERVRITGYTDGWYRVEYSGGTGYISESVLDIIQEPDFFQEVTPEPEPEVETFPLTVEGKANIRTGPGTQYDILGAVEAGDTLDALDRMGSWYIVLFNGQEGYIPANLAAPAD